MPEALHDPLVWALPFFVLFLLLEVLSFRFLDDERQGDYQGYEFRDARTSIVMGVVSLGINVVARAGALVGYVALYAVTPLRLDPHRWWTWVVVLLAVDLLWYAYHRASHRVRLMWAGHQAHHNSMYFNFSTAVRQKWNPWFELLFWVPLPLLGVPPWMIFTAFSFNLIYQFWVHTERIGMLPRWFEFVFNTPSHHRVHHASDPDYLDKNYAGILIVWDRAFGTYAHETHRPTYGLTKPVEGFNPVRLQYREYAQIARDVWQARGVRARLGYLFAPARVDAVTEPDLVAEIDVDAPPAAVWEAVGDPARMARWAPEGVVVKVLGTPRVGARTVNVNRRGFAFWPTSSTILRYAPEQEIAWSVPASGTVWSLELSPTPDGGTRLVNRRTVPGARPLVAKLFAPVLGGVAGHDTELAAGMHRTLAAIKADVERRR